MLTWLPSYPYPPVGDGYWTPITSTLDWCEENYYATIYAAELINTLTNLLFIYLAFKGVSNCLRNGHDTIFVISFIGYFVVGGGSLAFHATLKYPWQLVDELSMIYTTCLMCYASFARGRSFTYSFFLSMSLLALALFITGYYHYLQDPAFHQIAYGILTAIVMVRSVYVMEVGLRPQWKAKERELRLLSEAPASDGNGHMNGNAAEKMDGTEIRRVDDRDIQILKTMWTMIAMGLSIFLGGFLVWNLDNMYCSSLRRWRREVGLPWGIVLEGHGWWHLMTGVGAYFYLVWGIWLRHCLNNRQDEFELVWPSMWTSFPAIERKEEGVPRNGLRKKIA